MPVPNRETKMPYAITLLLDSQSGGKVCTIYKALADLKISSDQFNIGYPPHLTLATLGDDSDAGQLIDVLSVVAKDWQSSRISLAGFGVFPGTPSTLWLCPAVKAELFERHTALCAALPDKALNGHYRPGRWVPHVTLAQDLTEPSQALHAVKDFDLPIPATLEEVNLIHFRPSELLWRLPLAGCS
jgi:2'-5' RNA ligase